MVTQSQDGMDRRSLTRSLYAGQAVLLARSGVWTVTARDISTRGFGVVLDRELDPQARLVVELFNRLGNFWYRKGVQVIHATPHEGNTWLVGGIFVQEFSDEDLHALLGEKAESK